MSARLLCLLLLTTGIALPAMAQGQDRYINGTIKVPLRVDGSNDSGIAHPGLPSDTPVTIVQENTQFGWTQVRTREGIEGWLPSRYLKREPGPRYEILNALRLLDQPVDGSVSLASGIEAANKARDALQAELLELRQISSSATTLDQNNRALSESVQMLKNRISVLEADNARLRDDTWQKWFINGVWATGVGGLLCLVLPRIIPRRKRRSEWG